MPASAGKGMTSRQVMCLLGLAAVGIALRLCVIGRSYWFDELATVTNVDVKDWMTVLRITAHDNQPPLYNLMVFFWMKAVGRTEIAVRSLSFVIGLLALATPWLARTSLTRNEKLFCFAILCLMSLPIRYSQEARNYGLLLLLSSACLFTCYELEHRSSRALQAVFYSAITLLAFTHLFGLLLAVCFLAVVFLSTPRWPPRLALIGFGSLLTAAVMVPLIRGGAGQIAGGNFWITFTAATLARQMLIVLTPVGWVFLLYAAVSRRRERPSVALDTPLLRVLAPFGMMFVGAVVISLHTPILTDRNLIGLVPAFALLTVCLLRRPIGTGAAAVPLAWLAMLAVQASVLVYTGTLFIREDFRAIAEVSIARNEDVCYVVPNGRSALWQSAMNFYVSTIFKRPDLRARTFDAAEVPAEPGHVACGLWADGHPEGAVSLLNSLQQFHDCSPVALPTAQYRTHSLLVACPR
jgi:Dolichyl-phosphate-mannose-protein mannosyltransferase